MPLAGTANQDRFAPNASSTPILEQSQDNSYLDAARAGEQIVVDEQGRKRRRLNLVSSAPAEVSQTKEWYMGPDRVTISKLFYYADADEIPSAELDKDNDSFLIVGSQCPPAQRFVVNKRLRYFYNQKPIKLKAAKGFSQWAVVPYKVSDVPDDSPKLFTLYTFRGKRVTVSKEHIDAWPILTKLLKISQPAEAADRSDPFSYLLRKYPAQDNDEDAFPVYGESGSEGEFDEDTWEEIQEEKRTGSPKRPKELTLPEIDSTIQECIHNYETEWNEKCRPKEEFKAYHLWQAAMQTNSRYRRIKELSRDNSLLEKRLQKLIEAIREGHYTTKSELQLQCQSMEQTVMNVQKQKWRLSVLNLENAPRPVPAPPKSVSKKKPVSKDNDEESLHSDSDDMGDFIEFDTIAAPANYRSTKKTASVDSDDSDDDIISPSGLLRRSRQSRRPFMGSSSSSPPPRLNPIPPVKDIETVDLTADSPPPDDFDVRTPPLNPVGPTDRVVSQPLEDPFKTEGSPSPGPALTSSLMATIPPDATETRHKRTPSGKLSPLPEIGDIDGILSVPWDVLEKGKHRDILLAKLIAILPEDERISMAERIPTYNVSDLKHLIRKAISTFLERKDRIDGLSPSTNQLIMRTASFYISWGNCVRLQLKGILKEHILKAQNEIHRFRDFFKELCARLASSGLEAMQPDAMDTPHKKRKRPIKESQEAKREQESAQIRAALQTKQKERFEKKMKQLGVSNTDPTRQAVSFGDPVIYLDPQIGKYVKQHQLEGIRFMWRELMDEKQQGCLLAHTMGLGKTMQVISLLATISTAASSTDPNIRKQIPKAFHRSQSLILCPSSLIDNWYEEFLMWTPESASIGTIRRITTALSVAERIQEVSDWNTKGGVLILSYNIFRSWVLNNETAKGRKPLDDARHKQVTEWLLQGPNIIVADEAHKLKNPKSNVAIAAMKFRSRSRIALTGSPLTNNLTDYYTMVDWISEGYLPPFTEFNANYIEPIQEGLYLESTYREKRTSLVKLQVLNKLLSPKINRADITVLAGELPPKVEFVLTVPLTSLQQSAYDSYAEATLRGVGVDSVVATTLWSWLAVLQLCCNHPSCFLEKLEGRASKTKPGAEAAPGDELINRAGIANADQLVADQKRLFDAEPDVKAPKLSYRALLLDKIIDKSVRAGDKVLVFSHTLPTLDYIEHVLQQTNRKYCRLDGKTPVVSRQAATKKFNTDANLEVYLISTRAGGLGLNIPGANRVIIYDFSFSPFWEEQAIGRAYRLGQVKPVYVYRFISGGTFEEVMYNKALFKTQLAHRVVDKKNPIRLALKSLREWLFPSKPVPVTDVTEFLGKDPSVLDEIIKSDDGDEKAIRKITLTATGEGDDNDKLTEEERRGVQQQLDDERLRRTDPEAYTKLMMDRQREALYNLQAPQQSMAMSQWSSSHLPSQGVFTGPTNIVHWQQHQAIQRTVPASAHNTGPPALAPDMSVFQQARGLVTPAQLNIPMGANPPPQNQNASAEQSTGIVSNKERNPIAGANGFDGPADTEDASSDSESVDRSSDNDCNPQ
ncbi:hypothetical protein HFD88_010318 [Aspergillus terreus]|nr:hypothetical protein HFD88_010318 [Aspergillus terreus]